MTRLAPDLALPDPKTSKPRWQTLITAAFEHAFQWLGFGAKTAVGYGAMESTGQTETGIREEYVDPPVAPITSWPGAKLILNPGSGEIKASYEGKTTAGIKGDEANRLREALGERANKLKKDKELKNVDVRVQQMGNQYKLLGLA